MSSLHALLFKTWDVGLKVIRSGLPILIVIAGFTATLALSHSIRVQGHEHIWRTVGGEAEAISRTIQGVITAHIQSLLRMGRRWEFRRPSMVEWQDDARTVLEHSSGFETIDWVDPSFETQWSVHTGG